MKLYVANATRQVLEFHARIPEIKRTVVQRIPPGSQQQIAGDLNQPQIDAIVAQHAKYGMIPVDEIDRTRDFIGICYSVDKVILVTKIQRAMQVNNAVLTERGKKIRQDAAIVSHQAIENSLKESGRPETLAETESTILEDNHDDRSDSAPIAEGIVVARTDKVGDKKVEGRVSARRSRAS